MTTSTSNFWGGVTGTPYYDNIITTTSINSSYVTRDECRKILIEEFLNHSNSNNYEELEILKLYLVNYLNKIVDTPEIIFLNEKMKSEILELRCDVNSLKHEVLEVRESMEDFKGKLLILEGDVNYRLDMITEHLKSKGIINP